MHGKIYLVTHAMVCVVFASQSNMHAVSVMLHSLW